MKFKSRPLFLALTLTMGVAQAWPAFAADAPAAVERIVAEGRLDVAEVSRLHWQAVLDDDLDGLYARLNAVATSDGSLQRRAMALLAIACMRWQDGGLEAAQEAADQALTLSPGVDAYLLKARLMDAQGRPRQALDDYAKALSASTDARERAFLAVRIAVIQASVARQPQALAGLADAGSADANRAALVLGLLGRSQDAVALYRVAGQGSGAYDQNIRMAGWAVAAHDRQAARTHAWNAVAAARNAADQRYALAILVEAFRADDDLAGAVDFLKSKPTGPEVDQAKVDLLLELRRYDEAVAVVAGSQNTELRQRLLSVLDVSGRKTEVEAQYRRLIAQNPQEPAWYDALAALYLGQDQPDRALDVYRQMFTANRGRVEVLTAGARSMIAMGLSEPALAMLDQAAADPATATPVKYFLFETYLDQGEDAKARTVLDALRAATPAGDAAVVDLADGYERLGDKAQALAMLTRLEASGRALSYDQQAHIAELAVATGDDDAALARWRKLWAEARLPARKSYLERQIVSVGKRLGRLDQIAADLEARLASGAAREDEIDLLLGVRIAQGDAAAARADVETYAGRGGLSETEKLSQLIVVYARLKDYPALNATLRRLAQADPENAPLYLRRVLQNTLQTGPAPTDGALPPEAAALLSELNASSGLSDAQTRIYTAGIYASVGLKDQALDQYRRAMALAPADGDTLLQYADGLKAQGERAEAAALLQYAAEFATSDAGFATAVNGLMDVFAVEPNTRGGASDPALQETALAWAQRLVLERIATSGDDVRLNSLVADLGQARGDFALQIRAFDASLAVADDQRAAVLRQLIALTSGASGPEATGGPAIGDAAQKIVYGRRLIALKKEYPAEVYSDLAKALLASGDIPGAERAFAMMGDISGLVNVDQIKGDAYNAAGYADEALANYNVALLKDENDYDLILKASILRERKGQDAVANGWYWKGVSELIRRQPTSRAGQSEAAALDVSQYYPSLVEGLLITWPADEAMQAPMIQAWSQMFRDASAQIDPSRSLADYPRLSLMIQANRRLAERLGPGSALEGLEPPVAAALSGDPVYQADLSLCRHRIGASGVAPAVQQGWPSIALAQQARDTGNDNLRLTLALKNGDADELAAIAQQALSTELAWRAAIARGEEVENQGQFYALLRALVAQAPRQTVETLILRPLSRSPYADDVLLDLYRGDAGGFAALERVAGRNLIANDDLMRLLVARDSSPLPPGAISRGGSGDERFSLLTSRFSTDEMLDLEQRYVDRLEQTGLDSFLTTGIAAHLLTQPLTQAQQQRLGASLSRIIAYSAPDQPRSAARDVQRLLVLDVAQNNRAVLLTAAGQVADRYADGRRLPEFLQAYFAGDNSKAYQALMGLYEDTAANVQISDYTVGIVAEHFQAEETAAIQAFMTDDHPSAEQAAVFYRRYVLAPSRGGRVLPHDVLGRYYAKLVSTAPNDLNYLGGLLQQYSQQSDLSAFAATLAPYVQAHGDDREAATLLGVVYRLLGRADAAQAVTQTAGVDLDDVDWIIQMVNMASTPRIGGTEPDFRFLFGQMFDIYQARHPEAPAVAQIRKRRGDAPSPRIQQAGQAELRRLLNAAQAGPDQARGVLRGLWRDSAPGAADQEGLPRSALVAALPDADPSQGPGRRGRSDAALRAVLVQPTMSRELNLYLIALDPHARQQQGRLYDLLAQGLVDQGQGQARADALYADLSKGVLDEHGLHLFGALAARGAMVLDPEKGRLLSARLAQGPVMPPAERLLFAKAFAGGGDQETAGDLLTAAALQLAYPSSSDMMEGGGSTASLSDVVGALRAWPDQSAAQSLYTEIERMVTAARADDGGRGSRADPLPPLSEEGGAAAAVSEDGAGGAGR